jgi:hypothetical protein
VLLLKNSMGVNNHAIPEMGKAQRLAIQLGKTPSKLARPGIRISQTSLGNTNLVGYKTQTSPLLPRWVLRVTDSIEKRAVSLPFCQVHGNIAVVCGCIHLIPIHCNNCGRLYKPPERIPLFPKEKK